MIAGCGYINKHNNCQRSNHLNEIVTRSTCCSVQNEDHQTTITPINIDIPEIDRFWKIKLNDNFGLCLGRLRSKRLHNDERLLLNYDETIRDQLQSGIIEKLQLLPIERNCTRFLWLKVIKGQVTEDNIEHYPFKRVRFGAIFSPFSLSDSINHIPEQDRAETNKFKKILGISWNSDEDIIQITLKPWKDQVPTKRTVLQFLASQYDPFGFLTPCTMPIKLFLQNLWKEKMLLQLYIQLRYTSLKSGNL
ncbi:unnamed protein product [Brugia pahangi]|uniref:Uncharacterized protein n=1 Tax=Brugia pahangi TaxID=6280 RepID=A0A0N4T1J7_BRUPA|nr:unnamed protein product [Brugia pahangi]